ncbi:MAG: hypothetical protein ACRCXZ_01920 [Patescibacteria group bacterium]
MLALALLIVFLLFGYNLYSLICFFLTDEYSKESLKCNLEFQIFRPGMIFSLLILEHLIRVFDFGGRMLGSYFPDDIHRWRKAL